MTYLKNQKNNLELMLFENSAKKVKEALSFGVNTFLVDLEDKGKELRQTGYDTDISPGTIEDLEAIALIPKTNVWCRLNHFGSWTNEEVEAAINARACGLFLPMVKELSEVKSFLDYIDGRCLAGILIETVEAVSIVKELASLPLDRIYFGLNDFTISRNDTFLFQAVYDGTVEHVRNNIGSKIAFGFGGATSITGGKPIPAKNLLQEMARIGCSFTFLRRSFKHDIEKYQPSKITMDIQLYWNKQLLRKEEEEIINHKILLDILADLC